MRICSAVFLTFFVCLFFSGFVDAQPKENSQIEITYLDDKGNVSAFTAWPDERMKDVFERYWRLRFEGLWESTWVIEVPHFREMASEKKYKNYIMTHAGSDLISIEILEVKRETDNFVSFRCGISYRGDGQTNKFYTKDRWVKLKNKWYHYFSDPILFPSI